MAPELYQKTLTGYEASLKKGESLSISCATTINRATTPSNGCSATSPRAGRTPCFAEAMPERKERH